MTLIHEGVPSSSDIERQFPDGNWHSVDTKVTQTQDTRAYSGRKRTKRQRDKQGRQNDSRLALENDIMLTIGDHGNTSLVFARPAFED